MSKLFLIFLLLFSLNVFAIIDNYKVTSSVPLGKTLTIDGQLNPAEEIYCSFRIYDLDGNFIKRLTDEKSNSQGIFSSSYFVPGEPQFFRETDYNVITNCGASQESAVFRIGQREGIDNFFFGEIFYLTQNGAFFVIAGIAIIIFVAFVAVFIKGITNQF